MNHTLYVSDLDGTLLGPDAKVSRESVRMLNKAIAGGALFSVATARTPATVSGLLKDVDVRIPLVVMTGAALWDRETNTYINPKFHNEETARRLAALYREKKLSTFVYQLGEDNLIHIYHIGEMSPLERKFVEERLNSPFKTFHIPDDGDSVLPDRLDRVVLFYAMRPTEQVRRVHDVIKDADDLRAVFYHDMYGDEIALMEVFGPGASKAEAVKELASEAGAGRIVAYGDNVNDLPMMAVADEAVAVANAVPAVKEAADRIIGPNSGDSVAADILRNFSENNAAANVDI